MNANGSSVDTPSPTVREPLPLRRRIYGLRLGFMVALLVVLAGYWTIIPVRVVGISMSPTYSDGRLLLASPVPYWFRKPVRGDIILVGRGDKDCVYLKRIIGLPGECVTMQMGRLIVNGREVEEPYVTFHEGWRWPEVCLGEDEYLVAGDNRQLPPALQSWGSIAAADIRGRVLRQARCPRRRYRNLCALAATAEL